MKILLLKKLGSQLEFCISLRSKNLWGTETRELESNERGSNFKAIENFIIIFARTAFCSRKKI